MKIVALLQTYNERRFIANCIEHLNAQGVSVYLIDNESTDETVEIAERYAGRGLIGIEHLPRGTSADLPGQLTRKQQLAGSIDADWLMHIDADELHIAPDPRQSIADALRQADEAGFNAVNFLEFAFVPTVEAPDHDHPNYSETMRWYYPLVPKYPHRLNAWKQQDQPVDLVSSDGHVVAFPGLRMAPRNLYMRHFVFLSVEHAGEKYAENGDFYRTDRAAGWRVHFDTVTIELPSERRLRRYVPGQPLDRSEPLRGHMVIRRRST